MAFYAGQVPALAKVFRFLCFLRPFVLTVSQRQKFVGSAGALLRGKFLRVRKVFALNILLSIIFGTCLKITEVSEKFLYCLESFQIVLNVSYCLESFGFVWKFSV